MPLFLTPDEVRELTGIKRGKGTQSRESLQANALRRMRIPFHVNAIGRPIVARAMIEGVANKQEAKAPEWEPAIAHG